MIKAVFFDIDGTLISFKTHKVAQSSVDAVNALRAKGIKVIIATGRAFGDIKGLDGMTFDGYVTANGAYCVLPDGEVISKKLIPQNNLESLMYHFEENNFPCVFMTNKGNFSNRIDKSMMSLYNLVDIPVPEARSVKETISYDVFQLDAFVSKEEEIQLLKNVLTDCEATRWHPDFCDINVRGNDKSSGIDAFCEFYNIPLAATMALGDGGNDITMIAHAGIGIAMANAGDDVKDVADYITTSVDDDGVANALRNYGLIN